jgi:predicted nucleic acid-binding protein
LRVYLDANVVISLVETTRPLTVGQAVLVTSIDRGSDIGVTSELTVAETLVYPFRKENADAVDSFLSFLSDRPSFKTVAISRPVLLRAARIRAGTRLKLADAIHLATALEAGCTRFLTNDRDFRAGDGIEVVRWDEV